MIITQLSGGLGNQMFQYAAGLRLATHHDVHLKMDISSFKETKNHSFRLDSFENDASIATSREIDIIKRNAIQRTTSIFKWRYEKMALLEENSYAYQPIIENSERDTYLSGNWRSTKYFREIEDHVRSHFTPKKVLLEKMEPTVNAIKEMKCPVGLHVRRRGRVDDPSTHAYYGDCDVSYYHSAIDKICEQCDDVELLVFSDNLAWAKEHIKTTVSTRFVESFQDEHPVFDMYLMSHCHHNIIANSLYSWWSAWLNEHPNKMVMAPEKWFQNSEMYNYISALIPENWIKL